METNPGGDRCEPSAEVLFITDDPALAAVYRLRLEIDDYAVTWVEPAAVSGILGAVDPDLAYLDAMRFTQWFNLLGSPATVVPIAHSAEGLPIGLQLAGRPYADELVLAIASLLEQDFGYTPPPTLSTTS